VDELFVDLDKFLVDLSKLAIQPKDVPDRKGNDNEEDSEVRIVVE
jgi:hypothetical protein